MKTRQSTYALRLPASLKAAAEQISQQDGSSLNQFIATAVAEKISAMKAASFFAERRERVDWDAFDRIMARVGGEKPRAGDESA